MIKISDMTDFIQDDTVQFQIKDILSSDTIKKATANKIHGYAAPKNKTGKTVRTLLIAAVVVMLLSAGAFAAYRHWGLRQLTVPSDQSAEAGISLLSLAGLMETPEYEAAKQWEQLVQNWYQAGENLCPSDPDFAWDMYCNNGAFSQQARDALDTILKKYGLRMHESQTQVYTPDELYALAGSNGFLPDEGNNGDFPVSGKFYDDGTFTFNCAALLPGGHSIRYQLYCLAKGTFTRTGYLLADINDFEEWNYTTSDDANILLAISADKSILIADLEHCFVFINILSGTENSDDSKTSFGAQPVNRADLESFAEGFDFGMLNTLTA